MDILSYILSKKNNGSNTGGSGGTGGSGSSNASVVVKGGAVVDPAQTYSRLYFNTALSNEEVMTLMNNLELNYQGMGNILYGTDDTAILAFVVVDAGVYALSGSSCGILFAINGNLIDESITFTGWNPDIDLSNGIEISGSTTITEFPTDYGPVPVGTNNDKIVELFSSEPIKKSINKGLSGVYDGNNIEVGSTHIDISSLLDENKLPLNIDVVDSNLTPRNIVEGVNILGVEGTYSAHGLENEFVDRTLTTYTNNSVTSVGDYAFYIHKNLTTATFSNVTNIGQYAFYECDSLTSINSPKVTDIGQYAFYSCTGLTNVDFPEATGIGASAFLWCINLTTAKFSKVTNIGEKAFSRSSLTEINIPNVTNIGVEAFSYCSRLTEINIPNATDIGERAFWYCTNLASVNLPKITDFKESVFSNCGLINADFPNITSIGQAVFSDCKNLISVKLPKATSISAYVFHGCSSLTDVNIPNATDIGDGAFFECSSLTGISFPNATGIGASAFKRCQSLTEVNIPKAIHLKEYAFEICTSLTNADFPEASDLTYGAFATCTHLISVELPKVNAIGDRVFENCYSLNKVFIAQTEQICTLGQSVFSSCYHILGITNKTYNPNGLKDGYIYVPASLLSQYKVATNWNVFASQIIGHEDLEAGATLPSYTTDTFTTQTWYSDEKLTTVVTEVTAAGKYYCRLEA